MMKFICTRDPEKTFHIVSNRITKDDNGNDAVSRLQFAMRKFLGKETSILGFLPEDPLVHKAVLAQKPYYLLYPNAPVSKKLLSIANSFVQTDDDEEDESKGIGFLGKLRNIFVRGRV